MYLIYFRNAQKDNCTYYSSMKVELWLIKMKNESSIIIIFVTVN